MTDPNGNQTALGFDPLGMVVATAVMGKPGANEGDTLADPTTRLVYDVLAWQNGQGPAYAHTFAREQHGAANTRWLESYSYSDGAGHEVMKKIQAEPDATGNARWVGTGRTVFDNKGNPVKKYEPYFSPTPAYEDEPSIVMQGVTPILRYDPLGRLVRTDLPDGTFETVEFDAWSETHADANDNVLESAWYAANEALPTSDPRRRAADLAAQHAHTPAVRTVDPLGRTFLVVEDDGPAGKTATRTALDIQGNARSVTDARGNVALAQTFDLERRVLASTSMDAGDKRALRDVAGSTVRAWDARGFAIRTTYDRLRRPACVYVTPPGASEILAERIVYGEAVAGGAASNLRGRKVLHHDGAGELYLSSYDFQGNLTTAARQLAVAYQTTPDWTPLATSHRRCVHPGTGCAASRRRVLRHDHGLRRARPADPHDHAGRERPRPDLRRGEPAPSRSTCPCAARRRRPPSWTTSSTTRRGSGCRSSTATTGAGTGRRPPSTRTTR